MTGQARLRAQGSALFLIDLQERLMPAIDGGDRVLARAGQLLDGAALLGVPALASEQNPARLGPTLAPLCRPGLARLPKMDFSAAADAGIARALPPGTLVVAGVETHVCVLQTVLDLRACGRAVAVVEDATGSRGAADRDCALRRMAAAGAQIVTTEMVLFEWLGDARHPAFRAVQALIRQRP